MAVAIADGLHFHRVSASVQATVAPIAGGFS